MQHSESQNTGLDELLESANRHERFIRPLLRFRALLMVPFNLLALLFRAFYLYVIRHFVRLLIAARKRIQSVSVHKALIRRVQNIESKELTHYHLKLLKAMSDEGHKQLVDRLQTPSKDDKNVLISMVGASRRTKNPNNSLEYLLNSILLNTHDLSRVELVLRIDSDDDLIYYYRIKQRYGTRFRMRFVVGERSRGYRGLHVLVADTINYISPHSKIIQGCTDDSLITRKNWDQDFQKVDKDYPDNMFFINTMRDYTIEYDVPILFFWKLLAGGPAAVLAAVSRRIIDTLKEESQKYEGWTCYGNSVMCDSFFETLQMYIWHLTGDKREALLIDTVTILPDRVIPEHKEGGLFTSSKVTMDAFRTFSSFQTQEIIRSLAQAIARQMSDSGNGHVYNTQQNTLNQLVPGM